jgi:hypothetical protein
MVGKLLDMQVRQMRSEGGDGQGEEVGEGRGMMVGVIRADSALISIVQVQRGVLSRDVIYLICLSCQLRISNTIASYLEYKT